MSVPRRPEQRQAPRVTHSFLVWHRPVKGRPTRWSASPLRNLSQGGARWLTEHPLRPGEAVELKLRLPVAREPVQLTGRVAWAKTASSRMGLVEVGVIFDAMDAKTEELLEASLSYFLRREGKKNE